MVSWWGPESRLLNSGASQNQVLTNMTCLASIPHSKFASFLLAAGARSGKHSADWSCHRDRDQERIMLRKNILGPKGKAPVEIKTRPLCWLTKAIGCEMCFDVCRKRLRSP